MVMVKSVMKVCGRLLIYVENEKKSVECSIYGKWIDNKN